MVMVVGPPSLSLNHNTNSCCDPWKRQWSCRGSFTERSFLHTPMLANCNQCKEGWIHLSKRTPFSLMTFFFFPSCSIFSAAAIILNNISPPVTEALQCNGELFWRYKSLDLKNLPGVSVLCTTFLLCWSLYLAHAKEHLTFKDPLCTSSKCLHPLFLD